MMISEGEIMDRISPEMLAKAREMDLLTYLMDNERSELIRLSPGNYTIREHGSLKISNGLWMWWSHDIGGRSALDYLIKVRNIPFREAVNMILDKGAKDKAPSFVAPKEPPKRSKIILPERNLTDNTVITYLKSRGIDRTLIDCCINKGMLYESAGKHNCVFVGFDDDRKPRYAAYRSTDGTDVKGEVFSSDKRYSFRIIHPSATLHVFESAIDLLSYMTLMKIKTGKWIKESMVSLGGVGVSNRMSDPPKLPPALKNTVQNDEDLQRIILHLDNDPAGRAASKGLEKALHNRYEVINETPKCGKDVNEELILYKKGVRR